VLGKRYRISANLRAKPIELATERAQERRGFAIDGVLRFRGRNRRFW
jgi:hypothetical protein